MMIVTPTYAISVKRNASEKFNMRVPKTDLDAFLRVLTFNGCSEFTVVEEKRAEMSGVVSSQIGV